MNFAETKGLTAIVFSVTFSIFTQMESNNGKRVVDIWTLELEQLIEKSVNKVLDARLPKAPEKFYSVLELSKILAISRVSIYRMINQEKLSYRRVNGLKRLRFTQTDIDNFLLKNPGFADKHGF